MIVPIYTKENNPFPNNILPVLYYPEAFLELTNSLDAAKRMITHFEKNGYSNGWVNGIFPYHHFHSNTFEVLACISGEASVQLGGPGARIVLFKKGDVLLLPAGVAHKRMDATRNFCVVGAYPNNLRPDIRTSEDKRNYEEIKRSISRVLLPKFDPVEGKKGDLFGY